MTMTINMTIDLCQANTGLQRILKKYIANGGPLLHGINLMKIVPIINQKGGVGKSTTAHAVAVGLHLLNQKVLVIDLDGQGNLSTTLSLDSAEFNSMNVLENPDLISKAIIHTDGIDAIPAGPMLSIADSKIIESGREYYLSKALKLVDYDYVIIDTPPSLGVLTLNALTAATDVIIPASAETYSLQGVAQLARTIKAVRDRSNPSLKVRGILITRYNVRLKDSKAIMQEMGIFAEKLGTKVFSNPIRECVAIREAQRKRESIYSYALDSIGARDYFMFVDDFLKGE